jgi:lipoate---protein ligase
MSGQFIRKVPGGKLLRVSVESNEGIIESVRISGDFFAHPEDIIEALESKLKGAGRDEVREIVSGTLSNAKLYGLGGDDIIDAILEVTG